LRFPDYGKCKVRSIYIAQGLEKENILAHVLYGIFKPTTARKTWDERWQKSESNEFVHFWLGIGSRIYDYSAFQFGEREIVRTHHSDKRYEILGYYKYRTKELVHTGNLIIDWESLKEINGIPVVTMEPVFI
jgi:hypothetical protein